MRRLDDAEERDAFVADALARRRRDAASCLPTNASATASRNCWPNSDVEVVDFTDAAAWRPATSASPAPVARVALTGSIVVDAGRAGGRTVSLLPPLHVAFVRADAIVATPGDLWRALEDGPMPSNLVQITGPSRSADIELVITLGVHGPQALWVGVLD